ISPTFMAGKYPREKNCTCTLNPEDKNQSLMTLRTATFILRAKPKCKDYLEVTTNDKSEKLCGFQDTRSSYKGKDVTLNFFSSNTLFKTKGFWLVITSESPVRIRCGEALIQSTTPQITTTQLSTQRIDYNI
ncbi:unnamed protein product, partial [Owenia fusiformis]